MIVPPSFQLTGSVPEGDCIRHARKARDDFAFDSLGYVRKMAA